MCGSIPVPNAYTFAMRGKQPFIVVHTSLMDLLTPARNPGGDWP
jgi:Zn-dependent protease with chaperone function